jgi:hypothetical protein
MHKNATKCNKTLSKWCKSKHGASKKLDTFETYKEHHWGDSRPPWILLYLLQLMVPMKKKQKMEMTLKMWMSDDVFAFVICKFVLNFVMWI